MTMSRLIYCMISDKYLKLNELYRINHCFNNIQSVKAYNHAYFFWPKSYRLIPKNSTSP